MPSHDSPLSRSFIPKDFAERLGDVGPVDYVQGLGAEFVRMMEQTTCGSQSSIRQTNNLPAATLIALVTILMAYYR